MAELKVITPTTNVSSGSIDTVFIKDDAITLAKINTSGATDQQVLLYNSTSGNVEWDNIPVADITDKAKITEAPSLVSPLLHLKATNSGWNSTQILLEDSNDDAVALVGQNNTTAKGYQFNYTLDPNNTKPRTNVGGNGLTFAGDYFFGFRKNYLNQDEIAMDIDVYGAHSGLNIMARDDFNGGVNSYNWKPIRLKGNDLSLSVGSTPFGSTTEKLACNDFGTTISEGPLVVNKTRGNSNFQIEYTGSDTDGDPAVILKMHDVGEDRIMEILEATDYGSGDAAVVEIGKQLTVNPVKVASAVPIELANLSSAPGSPTAGMMYFNTTDSKFYGYNGSAWVLLDTQ